MSSHKTHSLFSAQQNLVGNEQHKQFIGLQAAYGIAQRGGAQLPVLSGRHHKRLVSDINLLALAEIRCLIFSETIISN